MPDFKLWNTATTSAYWSFAREAWKAWDRAIGKPGDVDLRKTAWAMRWNLYEANQRRARLAVFP